MDKIKKNNSKNELLAPAGNLEKLQVALAFGADAVYVGIPDFSLRVRINDFDLAKIKEATVLCHAQGKKIYVTINIFAHNRHFAHLPQFIKELKAMGVDALIISDPGVLRLAKQLWPQAEIHLSTQANCTNAESARFWWESGVTRVVLGREVTLPEIKGIKAAVPDLELEYFVHGAMCMSYSGRCFLSKYFLDKSANQGDCVQPCRWNYYISEERRPDQPLELVEEEHGSYILNSKDLCLIEHLADLSSAGVSSFKIEGRAKSVYYQAVVVAIYRKALDQLAEAGPDLVQTAALKKELETKLVHRGYTVGFLLGAEAEQNTSAAHVDCAWEYCGQALDSQAADAVDKDGYALVKVHNSLKIGDEIEIVRPGYDLVRFSVEEILDISSGAALMEAHGGQDKKIYLRTKETVPALSVIRRKLRQQTQSQL